MKLRLFSLRDTQSKKLVPGQEFSNKPEAKRARDELNKEVGHIRYVVTPGPDHHSYKP